MVPGKRVDNMDDSILTLSKQFSYCIHSYSVFVVFFQINKGGWRGVRGNCTLEETQRDKQAGNDGGRSFLPKKIQNKKQIVTEADLKLNVICLMLISSETCYKV